METPQFRVLFVCSGNSCRSPMAEGLLKAKLPKDLVGRVRIESAGTLGISGMPATDLAVKVVAKRGADISQHASQGLTEELASESDVIFALASGHLEFLHTHFPAARENAFLLRTFDLEGKRPAQTDVMDPIGGDIKVYESSAELIDNEIRRILPRLESLAREKLDL